MSRTTMYKNLPAARARAAISLSVRACAAACLVLAASSQSALAQLNEWAQRVVALLGAVPVITTASDVIGTLKIGRAHV